jgi:hypothetical protein
MDGISREIHTFAFVTLGNINTILLLVVTALIVVTVVVVVAAVVVVAVVIVVVAVAVDVHGTVFMNVKALAETDVVEVVAPAGSTAVLAMANNQDRKVAPMPTARIEWVEVLAHSYSSASGWGSVVTATGALITVFGQSVAGARYGDAVVAVNNRASDGEADREGEGNNNGGETHDDCRDPVWYTAILSWECDWAGLFIPFHR